MKLKLYKITAEMRGYDTYDSAVVVAKTEEQARNIHPSGYSTETFPDYPTWVRDTNLVTVELIGYTTTLADGDVVCASFNAG